MNEALLNRIEALKKILVDYATGRTADDESYKLLRREMISIPTISEKLPSFVKTCRDLSEFRGFIKPKFRSYSERREFLRQEFAPLLWLLETQLVTSNDAVRAGNNDMVLNSTPTKPLIVPCEDSKKRFAVALSFPGERRAFVEKVAEFLAKMLGRNRILYDKYYESEFARPNLDTHLQKLYHDESELIVPFLCADYERKEWCGLEWRALRDLIKRNHSAAVMPVRFDNTEVPGLFSLDGHVWVGDRQPEEIASLILERLKNNKCETRVPTPKVQRISDTGKKDTTVFEQGLSPPKKESAKDSRRSALLAEFGLEDDEYLAVGRFNEPTTIWFHHERFTKAFPGIRGISEITDPTDAVERLSILLKPPLKWMWPMENGYEGAKPLWWWRGGRSCPVENFKITAPGEILLDHQEMPIRKIVAANSGSYWQSFVYVEIKAKEPIGLYERDLVQDSQMLRNWGFLAEEYGLYEGRPISRSEFDDGAAIINGKPCQIDDPELRIRYISPYNFILAPHESPLNNPQFERRLYEMMNGILTRKEPIQRLAEEIWKLPKIPQIYGREFTG